MLRPTAFASLVWKAWAFETPAALWYGAMNYSVHAIMYAYFGLTSITATRRAALRAAPLVTALQVSQMAVATIVNVTMAVSYYSPSVGCSVKPPVLYVGLALYLAYGVLFVQIFVSRYVRPAAGGAASPTTLPAWTGCGVCRAEDYHRM